ncbi:hypothetical protein WG66_011262 [Moniliophthora roreri]|nr:hypothetical protein WG66_011262 [Moniliophthora roreri]
MQRPFDPNSDNSQGTSAAPFDDEFLDELGLGLGRPYPLHYPQYYPHRVPQRSLPAPNLSHPVLSVQTNELFQPQSFSPTSSMTSSSSSVLSPSTVPGYGARVIAVNYGGNPPHAEGQPYTLQSPSWPSIPMTSPSPGPVPFAYTVSGYDARATAVDYSNNSPMSPSAVGTTPLWYTDSDSAYSSNSVNFFSTSSSSPTSMSPTQAHRPTRKKDLTYFCEYCGKRFTAKHNLDYHIRSHTGERPYACRKCHKTFISLSDQKRHERDVDHSRS